MLEYSKANDTNLRKPFMTRFGPKFTTGGAVAAISDHKQRSLESVQVQIAVDMLHYNIREEDRNAAFRQGW